MSIWFRWLVGIVTGLLEVFGKSEVCSGMIYSIHTILANLQLSKHSLEETGRSSTTAIVSDLPSGTQG